MNIISYELKRFRKAFIFWMIGLFIMAVLGMTDYKAILIDPAPFADFMDSFPKIVLAIFGMNNLDITTLAGFYGVLFIYIILMGAIYAINLGAASTASEINDKTADFIYSKPISRIKVILLKNLAHLFYIVIFCVFSYLFTLIGFEYANATNNINGILILLHIGLFITMLIYYSFSSAINAYSPKYGYLIAIIALVGDYLLYIIYEMFGYAWLKYITPFKYFGIGEIIKNNSLELVFIIISVSIISYCIYLAYDFTKKYNIE